MNKKSAFIVAAKPLENMALFKVFSDINVLFVANNF